LWIPFFNGMTMILSIRPVGKGDFVNNIFGFFKNQQDSFLVQLIATLSSIRPVGKGHFVNKNSNTDFKIKLTKLIL